MLTTSKLHRTSAVLASSSKVDSLQSPISGAHSWVPVASSAWISQVLQSRTCQLLLDPTAGPKCKTEFNRFGGLWMPQKIHKWRCQMHTDLQALPCHFHCTMTSFSRATAEHSTSRIRKQGQCQYTSFTSSVHYGMPNFFRNFSEKKWSYHWKLPLWSTGVGGKR